jgi:hypothetical protein
MSTCLASVNSRQCNIKRVRVSRDGGPQKPQKSDDEGTIRDKLLSLLLFSIIIRIVASVVTCLPVSMSAVESQTTY